jgi:hypothetical protein
MNTQQMKIIERLQNEGTKTPEGIINNLVKESGITNKIFSMKQDMEIVDKKKDEEKYYKQKISESYYDYENLKRISRQIDSLVREYSPIIEYLEYEYNINEQIPEYEIYREDDNIIPQLEKATKIVEYTFIPAIMSYLKKYNIYTGYDEDKFYGGIDPVLDDLLENIIPSMFLPVGEMETYEFYRNKDYEFLNELTYSI